MNNIEVKNLNYRINNKQILEDISLRIAAKQFIGILGPNGSGKTSLLKHIYRTLPVEKGKVFINGADINDLTSKDSSKLVTVMKQENSIDFDYSILEMVLMGRSPHRKFYEKVNSTDYSIAKKALKYVGLDDRLNQSFRHLSGGEKQRVFLARSIAQDVEIFLLDEPTNNLDIYYQWNLINLIKNLNKTIVAILHEINLAFRFCDYVYIINNGKIHSHGKPEEVITETMLRDVMKIDAKLIEANGIKSIIIKNAI